MSQFTSVTLLKEKTKVIDLRLCCICQKPKDKNGTLKLTSTENGRQKILETSKALNDSLLTNLNEEELFLIFLCLLCHRY